MSNDFTNDTMSTSDRIIYAAMQIIAKDGLRGLSASKLAEAANISKSTVFHYFKKMDDIPPLILEKLYVDIINPIQEVEYSGVRAYLIALGESSFSKNEQHIAIYKAFASLFQASMHDKQLQQIVSSCAEQFSLMVFNKLLSLCPEGIEQEGLKALTNLVIMSLDGIGLHYLTHGNQELSKAAWRLFVDAIIEKYGLERYFK